MVPVSPPPPARTMMHPKPTGAPSVAYIVAGQCRPSPLLLGTNDSALATRKFLSSYMRHVVAAHGADVQRSTVYLLLKEGAAGDCGDNACRHIQHSPHRADHVPLTCIQQTLSDTACREACPLCEVNGARMPKLRNHKCFSQSVLASWTPAWCTMWQAWRVVRRHEQASAKEHERIIFSRIDLLYETQMGHYTDYSKPWHSGHVYCHDMFWIFSSRALAACAMSVYAVQLNCTHAQPCCNRHWKVSWWPWSYCLLPGVNPEGERHLHGVIGNFTLVTRRDGPRHCAGAPTFTAGHDPGPPQAHRLTDGSGNVFASG